MSDDLFGIAEPDRGIYAIVHVASGRRYIGSSENISARFESHRKSLRLRRHHNVYLQRAWDKYGADAFDWVVVELVGEASRLLDREQSYIDGNIGGFNVSMKAGRPPSAKGLRLSDSHKVKLSMALKGRRFSAETLAKMSAAQARRAASGRMPKMSDWQRRVQSERRKGRPEFMAACHAVVGAANKRRVWTDESRRKSSESHREYYARSRRDAVR